MSCGVCFLLAGFICWIVVGYGGSAPSTAGELHSNKFIPFFVSASSPLLSFGFAPAKRTASLIDSFVFIWVLLSLLKNDGIELICLEFHWLIEWNERRNGAAAPITRSAINWDEFHSTHSLNSFASPRSIAAGALVDCSSFAGPVRSFIWFHQKKGASQPKEGNQPTRHHSNQQREGTQPSLFVWFACWLRIFKQ